MPRPTLAERLRYWFDSVMARGTASLMGLLALVSLAFIMAVTAVVVIFRLYPPRLPSGLTSLDPSEIFWGSLTRVLSSGSFREDEGWAFRIAMLVVTLAGLVVVASLIGIIGSAFDRRLVELRRGRSRVLETGHTVILGSSSKIVPIVAELQLARRDRRRSAIVLMSRRDKIEVEDELRSRLGRAGTARVIVRSGDPMDPTDLAILSPHAARTIIVLAPDGAVEPDMEVIKTVLALSRTGSGVPIIGELRSADRLDAAKLAGTPQTKWIIGDELIGRLTVHSVRHDGISVVSRDLLDFDGDEFYVIRRPELAHSTFAAAQRRFEAAKLVGLIREGRVHLNPLGSEIVRSDDELIIIAQDDQAFGTSAEIAYSPERIVDTRVEVERAERTLVLGHHRGMRSLITSLHSYFSPGSTAHVVSTAALDEYSSQAHVTTERADTTKREVLDALDIPSYSHVVIVPDKDSLSSHSADARTLVTLLHLRDIRQRSGADFAVVAEMLDDRNSEIVEDDSADDVIVSDLFVSRMLAQVARTPRLIDVFDVLFGHAGSETQLCPVRQYVAVDQPVSISTLIEAASRRGETFIGYRLASQRVEHPHFGVVINPPTSSSVSFTDHDHLIVLADR